MHNYSFFEVAKEEQGYTMVVPWWCFEWERILYNYAENMQNGIKEIAIPGIKVQITVPHQKTSALDS